MLFSSFEFIFLFLPLTFLIYFLLAKKNLTNLIFPWLIVSSLFYYSYWNINFITLILLSIIFNFTAGSIIQKKSSKFILILAIACNLGLLAFYKYTNFLIENFNLLFQANLNKHNITLPLAISFFTFQQIAYLVDCYKQEVKAYSFNNYALFVSFFPQLIAGPIVHHKEMMTQFNKPLAYKFNLDNFNKGLFLFSVGLFKKIVLADTFAIWVNSGFNNVATLNFSTAWLSSLSYTFQLYFDFSGYADMALGTALLFNIKLPINFNSPYRAFSIIDFWQRWHITLSRFLRDYLYIPLGGNKKGNLRRNINLFLTMLLGGLWHGAAWSFVAWGAMHGAFLMLNHLWKKMQFSLPKPIAWALCFLSVNFAWVYFRANSLTDANTIILNMLDIKSFIKIEFNQILFLIIGFIIVLFKYNSNYLVQLSKNNHIKILSLILFVVAILQLNNFYISQGSTSDFLYFNF